MQALRHDRAVARELVPAFETVMSAGQGWDHDAPTNELRRDIVDILVSWAYEGEGDAAAAILQRQSFDPELIAGAIAEIRDIQKKPVAGSQPERAAGTTAALLARAEAVLQQIPQSLSEILRQEAVRESSDELKAALARQDPQAAALAQSRLQAQLDGLVTRS